MLNPKMTALKAIPLEEVLMKLMQASPKDKDNIWTVPIPEDIIKIENNNWQSLKRNQNGDGAISLVQYWLFYHPDYLSVSYQDISKKTVELLATKFEKELNAMNSLTPTTSYQSIETKDVYNKIEQMRKDVMQNANNSNGNKLNN